MKHDDGHLQSHHHNNNNNNHDYDFFLSLPPIVVKNHGTFFRTFVTMIEIEKQVKDVVSYRAT